MKRWCWSRKLPWRGHEFGAHGMCKYGSCLATQPPHPPHPPGTISGVMISSGPGQAHPKEVPATESRDKPFVGWRAWKLDVDDDGPVLVSTFKETRWTGPVLHAHEPPPFNRPEDGVAYGPGIYAMKDWSNLTYPFIGTVELWGRVVEHEMGYRGEHALVTGLYHMPVESFGSSDGWFTISFSTVVGSQTQQVAGGGQYSLNPDAPTPRPEILKALAERYQCPVDTERFRRIAKLRQACKEPYEWTSDSQNDSGKSSPTASSLHAPSEEEMRNLLDDFRPSLLRQSLSER